MRYKRGLIDKDVAANGFGEEAGGPVHSVNLPLLQSRRLWIVFVHKEKQKQKLWHLRQRTDAR